MRTHKKPLIILLAATAYILAAPSVLAAPVVLQLDFDIPVQQNQVAFVPFAGDSVISSVVANDLKYTDLKVTSSDLPQQPHSSRELSGTLPVWQSMGIPYLVVGNTRSDRGKIITDYEVIEVNTGRVIEGKQSVAVDKRNMRYAGHVIADKVHELITGIPGDFSGLIAYIEESGRGKDMISRLKVMDADGQNIRTIATVKGSIFSPAWSPDASRIAYSVQLAQPTKSDYANPVIHVQNVSGDASILTPFGKGNNLSPSFSPDGSKILFSGSFEGSPNIYEISASGGTPRRLTKGIQPSYAPDGQSFVYVYDNEKNNQPRIYRYTFGSGSSQQISRGGYATTPKFNADGTQIAYLSGISAAVMSSGGSNITSFGNTGTDEAPSFSPNGKRVVYASKQGDKGVLTIKSIESGVSFNISGDGVIRSPVWSASPK